MSLFHYLSLANIHFSFRVCFRSLFENVLFSTTIYFASSNVEWQMAAKALVFCVWQLQDRSIVVRGRQNHCLNKLPSRPLSRHANMTLDGLPRKLLESFSSRLVSNHIEGQIQSQITIQYLQVRKMARKNLWLFRLKKSPFQLEKRDNDLLEALSI